MSIGLDSESKRRLNSFRLSQEIQFSGELFKNISNKPVILRIGSHQETLFAHIRELVFDISTHLDTPNFKALCTTGVSESSVHNFTLGSG